MNQDLLQDRLLWREVLDHFNCIPTNGTDRASYTLGVMLSNLQSVEPLGFLEPYADEMVKRTLSDVLALFPSARRASSLEERARAGDQLPDELLFARKCLQQLDLQRQKHRILHLAMRFEQEYAEYFTQAFTQYYRQQRLLTEFIARCNPPGGIGSMGLARDRVLHRLSKDPITKGWNQHWLSEYFLKERYVYE